MKSRLLRLRRTEMFCAALLFASVALPVAAQQKAQVAHASVKNAAASAANIAPDKGKFRILQDGSEVGTEDFDLSAAGGNSSNGGAAIAWAAHGQTTIHGAGGAESRSTGEIRLAADGTPVHYQWSAEDKNKASGTVDFDNGTAKTTANIAGKDFHADYMFTTPKVAVLDNNLFDQYALLAYFYDWNAGGTQTFPVLIPQDNTPGSIAVTELGNAQSPELQVRTADLEVDVYFDSHHRLMRLEVPAGKYVITRQ